MTAKASSKSKITTSLYIFYRASPSGPILEDSNEHFGNDLVIELELENARLRHQEEELRREFQARYAAQQVRKQQLMARIRELESMVSPLGAGRESNNLESKMIRVMRATPKG